MKKLIYINDSLNGNLIVSLDDIMDDLSLIGNRYKWSILDLEASGDLKEIASYSEIDEYIKNSPHGYCVSWNGLRALANKFTQVINLLIVASEHVEDIRLYSDNATLYKTYPIVIEIVDGDCWEICTSNTDIIRKMEKKYKEVTLKELHF